MDNEIRCEGCGKLLAKRKGEAALEIKCTRCGAFNSILEEKDDQVVVTDKDGVILFANEATERATGYPMSRIVGERPSLCGQQMPREFYQQLWREIRDEKRAVAVTVRNRREDGTLYSAHLRISPVLDTSGEVRFFVGIESVVGERA